MTYAEILSDERTASAIGFLTRAIDWFRARGVIIERVMTDNGSAYLSHEFAIVCRALNVRHIRTRPYTPRTNGKVERMIQTLLREWAYRFTYNSSDERGRWLKPYLHFYNVHRAHSSLSYNPPISRLDKNNGCFFRSCDSRNCTSVISAGGAAPGATPAASAVGVLAVSAGELPFRVTASAQ